jgi:hypothetical protein
MEDLAAIDAIAAGSRPLGGPPIPVVTRVDDHASGAALQPVISEPVETDASDHYRVSSPNRIRGQQDTTMRHRRVKR